jgi:hypothetical protein
MNAAVLIAALAGVQCHVAASTTRDGITTTAPEILRYSFLSHGKFVDQSGEVGPMDRRGRQSLRRSNDRPEDRPL